DVGEGRDHRSGPQVDYDRSRVLLLAASDHHLVVRPHGQAVRKAQTERYLVGDLHGDGVNDGDSTARMRLRLGDRLIEALRLRVPGRLLYAVRGIRKRDLSEDGPGGRGNEGDEGRVIVRIGDHDDVVRRVVIQLVGALGAPRGDRRDDRPGLKV